jgi:hypothetical protein
MRRRLRMLLLAAAIVAFAVPFGTALTLDRRTPVTATVQASPTAIGTTTLARPLPQAGALMLTGWVLIGLAAALRRAV